ncbi:MAG: PQQ-dependent sugar dehydrogenase [Gammaproteobacteria bacterium]|nr:PQQ-dependent sugar dehydrogenase [Gammaproteobacteria bacterium]TVQ48688.1 MAG: PQQ-dependent sugar dehydrogenase [Gammaproteobacteria bacterium]
MSISLRNSLVPLAALALLAGCSGEPTTSTPINTAGAADSSNGFEPRELRSEYHRLNVARVAGGLSHPWGLAFLPDGDYLVTERTGDLLRISPDGSRQRIEGVPEVAAFRQGGLLDVILHPQFSENGWVYLSYSRGDSELTTTAVVRGRLEDNRLVDVEDIFEQDRRSEPGRHYGSRFAWMADGTLLVSIGDRGAEPPRAQDLGDHAGTVLRLHADGSVPEDNPFVGHEGALPEIWAYGSRNIQGMVIDPVSGKVWATEHGPRGGDELNLIEPGNNYGWPDAGLGRDYRTEEQYGEARSLPGMVDPIYEILPTLGPSGLALVTSDRFPRWQGNLLAGGLRAERLRRLVIENDVVVHDEELLTFEVGRIRDVREGPDGAIYVLTDHDDGGLYRVDIAD